MQDGQTDHLNHVASEGTREITGEFINVSTQSIHEHKIAEIYRTNLAMFGISLGYIINF